MMKGDDWPPLDITKSQLLTELGRPNSSILSLADGKSTETLTWVYARAESNPALFVPVVGLFVAASGEGIAVNSIVDPNFRTAIEDGSLRCKGAGHEWKDTQEFQ